MRPINNVKNIFNIKSFEIILVKIINGICEIIANINNLKKYFLRLFVCV
mgnify:CR=1 FL=1